VVAWMIQPENSSGVSRSGAKTAQIRTGCAGGEEWKRPGTKGPLKLFTPAGRFRLMIVCVGGLRWRIFSG